MRQIIILVITLLMVSCNGNKDAAPPVKDGPGDASGKSTAFTNASAEKMLRSFYTEYIMQGDLPPTDKARMAVIRKYCTPKLAQEIEEASLDSDPFLRAQDSDPATVKTLVIHQDDKNKDIYSVCYTWPSTNQIICTDVTVTAVGDDVKISFIELNGY